MKLKKITSCLLAAGMGLSLLTGCGKGNSSSVPASSETEDPSSSAPTGKRLWWKDWPIFSNNGTILQLEDINADASTAIGIRDEGIGSYFRRLTMAEMQTVINSFQQTSFKMGAWIEGYGDSRVNIAGLHRNEDGSYQWNDELDGARILANTWSWDSKGLGVPGSEVNTVVWTGVHSYVNREDWLGKNVLEDEITAPTYPDGTPAVGYLNDDASSPLNARLYDACSSKDINGNINGPQYAVSISGNTNGVLAYESPNGQEMLLTDFSVGKDVACPWWLEYQRLAVRELLAAGVDSFWIDNYDGWDTVNCTPTERAFGDWSEALFRDYLKEHPEVGIADPEEFSITVYLKSKCREFNPGGEPDFTGDTGWLDERWAAEPVWSAYKAFKSQMLSERYHQLYDIIKEEAEKLGRNPDEICVTGNGGPVGLPDHIDGLQYDLPSTEYTPAYNTVTGTNYNELAPIGGGGNILSLFATMSKRAVNASIWYYCESGGYEKYQGNPGLGMLCGYEALAHNVTINSGSGDIREIGSDKSARKVNKSIQLLKEAFGARTQYSEVGVMFSQASEYINLLPGGYNKSGVGSTLGYLGWTMAMQKQNIPYVGFMDYRLEEMLPRLKVLVLPNMISCTQATIDGVLKPWLDQGNTLIVSGDDAGSQADRAGIYALNSGSLLADFARSYQGAGKAVYLEEDPGEMYYYLHTQSDGTDPSMMDVKAALEQAGWDTGSLLTISGMEQVLAVLHYDREAGAFFTDLVNYHFDWDADAFTQKLGGEIRVKLPEELRDTELRVEIFNADEQSLQVAAEKTKAADGYLTVTIPTFEMYASVIIRRA